VSVVVDDEGDVGECCEGVWCASWLGDVEAWHVGKVV
jgi:hypothetical protein